MSFQLAACHSSGVDIFKFPLSSGNASSMLEAHLDSLSQPPISIATPSGQSVKLLKYSHNGKIFVFSTGNSLFVYEAEACRLISTLACATNVLDVEFSPLDRHLSVLETFNSTANEKNLKVYRIKLVENAPNATVASNSIELSWSFSQKIVLSVAGSCWAPQFNADENLMALLRNKSISIWKIDQTSSALEQDECTTLERNSLNLSNVHSFCLVLNKAQVNFCCFYKGSAGGASNFKVFRYPNFDTPLCSRILPNADSLEWVKVPVEQQKQQERSSVCDANAVASQSHQNPPHPRLLLVTSSDHDKTGKSYYGQSSLYYVSCFGQGQDSRVSFDKAGPVHHCAWSGSGEEFLALYGFMPSKGAIYDSKCNVIKSFGEISRNACGYNGNSSLFFIGGFGNLSGCIDIWHRKSMSKVCTFQEPGASICQWLSDGIHLLTATVSPRLRVDNGFKIFNVMGQKVFSKEYAELFNVVVQPLNAAASSSYIPADLTLEQCRARSSPLLTAQTVKKVSAYVPPSMRKSASQSSIGAFSGSSKPSSTISPLNPQEKALKNLKKKLENIALLKEKAANGQTLEINQLEKISKEEEYKKELAALSKCK